MHCILILDKYDYHTLITTYLFTEGNTLIHWVQAKPILTPAGKTFTEMLPIAKTAFSTHLLYFLRWIIRIQLMGDFLRFVRVWHCVYLDGKH